MAQDNRSQQQNQPPRPAVPAETQDLLSSFYTKANMPSDLSPLVRGLLVRGWSCAADNSRLERGEWYAPGASDTATMTEKPLRGLVMRPNPEKADADGAPAELVEEQLMMQDGTEFGRLSIPIKRTTVRPATRPMSFQEAVRHARAQEAQSRREQKKPVAV